MLADDIYNDLGFRVSDRFIILVEAQSTWTVNIIIRAFFYLSKTYKDYMDDNGLDIYKSKRLQIPKPELYVLYTGDRKIRPKEISLKDEFFKDEEDIALDVKVKVLYGTDEDDVVSQYVMFTKVYDEQRKIHGRTLAAIQKTLRICKDKNILREYLENREKEVVDIMMTLFDEEQIMKNHDADLTREVTKKVTRKVTSEVTRENQKNSVRNLMETLKLTAEQAMDALKIPVADREKLYEDAIKLHNE